MNAAEQHVATAAKMYECRTAARQILGEKYQDKMRELSRVVRAVARRDKCNDIVAGATVIKSAGLEGMQALMLMAAVVEMVEPSNVELSGGPHTGAYDGTALAKPPPVTKAAGGTSA